MHPTIKAAAAGIMLAGCLSVTPTAHAAISVTHASDVAVPIPAAPTIEPLDCAGTTGVRGCGGGWFWRDGWRGYGCYPC